MPTPTSPDQVRLGPLDPAGIPAFAALVDGHPMFQEYGLRPARLATQLAGALERGDAVLTATLGNDPAGLVWFMESGTFSTGGYIRLIVVSPRHTGAGIGGLLMDAAEAAVFRGTPHLFLLVNTGNRAAQAFYRRRGYRQVGELPSFAAPGVDEYIYYKGRER